VFWCGVLVCSGLEIRDFVGDVTARGRGSLVVCVCVCVCVCACVCVCVCRCRFVYRVGSITVCCFSFVSNIGTG
jgi:hypothetical protein